MTFLWVALYLHTASAVVALVQLQRHMHSPEWRPGHLMWLIGEAPRGRGRGRP